MIKFLKNKKQKNNKQSGMTYVELIVVLSIFALMTSVVIFNYGAFQAKVDIKNLASDMALNIVEAQKSAISGALATEDFTSPIGDGKPSYGIYFDKSLPQQFIYFADLNNTNGYEVGEALNTVSLTKGAFIDKIERCVGVTCTTSTEISPLSISFKRPDSRAVFTDSNGDALANDFDYIQVTLALPSGANAKIKVYPSGRIQVN